MYFWNIKQLKAAITEERLAERHIFIYTLITLFLTLMFMELSLWVPYEENHTTLDMSMSALSIIMPMIGLYGVYRANGSHSGRNFLSRYVSISFVVGLRFFVLLLAIMVLFIVFSKVFEWNIDDLHLVLACLLVVIGYAIYYWRVCRHVHDVSISKP